MNFSHKINTRLTQENNLVKICEISWLKFDVRELSYYIEINKIGLTSIQGKILPPVEHNINELKEYFFDSGFIAYFDKTNDEVSPHIINLAPADPGQLYPAKNPPSITLNIVLFVATVFTTLLVGAFNRGGNPFAHFIDLLLGVPFSFSLLLILTGHELGHYFTSRHYGVSVTLPYFLPIPHPLIGTMGAFIRIKSVLPNRRALVRIGAAGPIIGFILAIPITIIGIGVSKIAKVSNFGGGIGLGSSLLFKFFSYLLHPHIPQGYDLVLHPMAFAGWLGFFVTAMNLLPLGQLDGGHIAYAILGKYRRYATIGIIVGMVLLGLLWPGWFFWIALIFIFGLRHPKSQDEITQLRTSDKILAGVALAVLILAFIPVPFPIK
jgi:membrane-associated protease RseP (regulator of RpoE activity)